MYFPYVRGKQFELLALKEISGHFSAHRTTLLPVIEPVRAKGDALVRCLDALTTAGAQACVVVNPSVGELASGTGATASILEMLSPTVHKSSIRIGVQVRAGADINRLRETLGNSAFRESPVDLIHQDFSSTPHLAELASSESFHFVKEKAVARRYRPRLQGSEVKFEDRFPAQRTNLEYVGVPASLFTDDNIYFIEDGYAGWGDFATIGDLFSEGGSSPRAVVIHLTYLNSEDGAIWIRHFCSQSNEDTADTAGKFGEALASLVSFCDEQSIDNPAISAFRAYHRSQSYPGLGMLKKLSIQNHVFVATQAMAS